MMITMEYKTSIHGGISMAISPNTPIDFAKIALQMRETVARWYNAEIEIVDPDLGEQEWDPITNDYGTDSTVVLWSGRARIQPLKQSRGSTPNLNVMQGGIEAVRIQVPYDPSLPLIRKGLQIRVVDGAEDEVLSTVQFVVRSAINSSYGWNRTIECDADVKNPEYPGGS
jgi:hypothetical protein